MRRLLALLRFGECGPIRPFWPIQRTAFFKLVVASG